MVVWKWSTTSFAVYCYEANNFIVPADGHQGASVAVVLSASTSYNAGRQLSGSKGIF